MKTLMRRLLLAGLVIGAGSFINRAHGVGPAACSADMERLCAGQKSKSLCLIDHESELAPACQEIVKTWSNKEAQASSSWLGVCSMDAERLCGGQPSVSHCLMEQQDHLSSACQAIVRQWTAKSASNSHPWYGACTVDAERLCSGKHAISLCMSEHHSELSPACQKSMPSAPSPSH